MHFSFVCVLLSCVCLEYYGLSVVTYVWVVKYVLFMSFSASSVAWFLSISDIHELF